MTDTNTHAQDPAIVIETDRITVAAYTSTVEPFDIDRAVADLVELRAIKQALTMWEGELTDWLAEALGHNHLDIDGVGHVEAKHGTARKEWDHDALWRAVVARARDDRRVDPETGEVLESEGEAVGRVLGDCARPSWRLTPLRALGLDPDEYCAASPGKTSIVIT